MSFVSPELSRGGRAPRWDRGETGEGLFVPCVRVRTESLLVNDGGSLSPRFQEIEAAVLELSFDYGGVRVRAAEPGAELPQAAGSPITRPRDLERERQARYLLESFGAVELACLDDMEAAPGSRADYVVRVDGDVHALCSFTAYAVPQLRSFGWRVDVAGDYPWQVIDGDIPWYANIDPADSSDGWFSLELGIEVEGRRVNLLPAIVDLLDRLPARGRLDGLATSGGRLFALPVGANRYVTVPAERLRILVKVLRELYDGEGAVRFPAAKAALLAPIDEALGERVNWTGATAVRERGQALSIGPARATPPPRGLRATLRPYQQDGLAWLQHLRQHDAGGILADDMGLGKTLQTIAHLAAEKESGRMDGPALVVAPTSLLGNWRREIGRFAPHLRVVVLRGSNRRELWKQLYRYDVALITYAALVRDEERLEDERFYMLILDEAQAIKNPRSLSHGVVKKVNARYRLSLSGTPVENNLTELWAQMDFLMPGLLGDADWFRHRYAVPIEREGNAERMKALREQVAPFILRRTKEQVARDLPPKTEIVRPVELRGSQRDLYESLRIAAHADVRRAIASKGIGAATITILDALMKLRQVCCDPRLVAGTSAEDVRESAKYELLFELLPQQLERGRRILIFSQFATMLGLIGKGLLERKIPFVSLTGATGDRQKPIDAFEQRRVDVFLISLKAGGTGINLTSADTVIHYDPWWNPAAQAQATDRAHRIGQTRPVFVHNLIVAGSVEERMLRLQNRKRELAESLLGAGDAASLRLSEREVDQLFAPLAGEP